MNRAEEVVIERKPFSTGDAIALGSPNGTMSKRSRKAALKRLELEIFGPEGMAAAIAPKLPEPPSLCESLIRQAEQLEALADRGMCVRKYRKLAAQYRKEAGDES